MTSAAILFAWSRIEAARSEVIERARPTDIVVAARSIRSGDPFTESNLAKKAIPIAAIGKRNVRAEDFALLQNANCRSDIEAGEPILWTDVEEPFEPDGFSLSIAPGKAALTLEASTTSSFAGLVQTGDRIDFLCNPGGIWIRDIEVLAVDRHFDRAGAREPEEISTLTVSVGAVEGARLSQCETEGSLTWFLRNPNDNTSRISSGSWKKKSPAIEIWKGGIPEEGFVTNLPVGVQ